ncbi:hypothetical protein B0J12DRAFT_765414 [Macrophomina phaseolina]|uniref:Sacsin/Nov domain-containing protein n=1 Tax=Macrophomina phaseolina TaxID=35725 RepID=A0ABQ8FZ15_9PEZI|nr:hypothetical protein B0J12DRAFT_765414 [Macrophomina phaseolina]
MRSYLGELCRPTNVRTVIWDSWLTRIFGDLRISEDLNSTSFHFLLELLQNADDNKYDDTKPTLALAYTEDKHFRLHCNEKGFSPEDVEAICDIGNSTKLSSASTTGEKGVGFKSVFRVARAVWIVSGEYQFMLHRDRIIPLEGGKASWTSSREASGNLIIADHNEETGLLP